MLLASGYRRQTVLLEKLVRILQLMQWELKYRLTALPDLCAMAAKEGHGPLREIFAKLSQQLEHNAHPDVSSCMNAVLKGNEALPPRIRRILRHLGRVLGRFDLEGQLQGMESILEECRREKEFLEKDRDFRLKSYQTLGICTGVALVILLL